MDRAKKVVNERHERILLELTRQPGNDTCADCGAKGPRWASHNLGIFLCIRCGGLHRKMGTHISKVKSISLDSWTPEQVENMKHWGNLKANSKWNPHPERHPVPVNASDSEMERYIRNKYERQTYIDNQNKRQHSSISQITPSRGVTTDSTIKYSERGDNDSTLRQLKDMGFTDIAKNHEVLSITNGDLSAAIEILCRLHDKSSPAMPAQKTTNSYIPNDDKPTQFRNIGFNDEAKNHDIRRSGSNINIAATHIDSRTLSTINNTSNIAMNSSTNSQLEQQRKQQPLTQNQSFNNSSLLPQISTSQFTSQNQSQNSIGIWDSFCLPTHEQGTNIQSQQQLLQQQLLQQQLLQQRMNKQSQQQNTKFDKSAILSLYSTPPVSMGGGFNSYNNVPQFGNMDIRYSQQGNVAQNSYNTIGNSLGMSNGVSGHIVGTPNSIGTSVINSGMNTLNIEANSLAKPAFTSTYGFNGGSESAKSNLVTGMQITPEMQNRQNSLPQGYISSAFASSSNTSMSYGGFAPSYSTNQQRQQSALALYNIQHNITIPNGQPNIGPQRNPLTSFGGQSQVNPVGNSMLSANTMMDGDSSAGLTNINNLRGYNR